MNVVMQFDQCGTCSDPFSIDPTSDHRPVQGKCGHNMCLACVNKLHYEMSKQNARIKNLLCPFCGSVLSFRADRPVTNVNLLAGIRAYREQQAALATAAAGTTEVIAALEGTRVTEAIAITAEPSVVDVMTQVWDGHARVVQRGLESMATMCSGDDNHGTAIQRADQQHQQIDDEQEDTIAKQNANDFGHCGGALATIKAMYKFESDEAIQVAGCRALACMAFHSHANRALIGELGGITTVIGAMHRHADAAELQEMACWALRSLCSKSTTNNIRAVADGGGIPILMAAMKQHPENANIQGEATAILFKLASLSEETQYAIARAFDV